MHTPTWISPYRQRVISSQNYDSKNSANQHRQKPLYFQTHARTAFPGKKRGKLFTRTLAQKGSADTSSRCSTFKRKRTLCDATVWGLASDHKKYGIVHSTEAPVGVLYEIGPKNLANFLSFQQKTPSNVLQLDQKSLNREAHGSSHMSRAFFPKQMGFCTHSRESRMLQRFKSLPVFYPR